MCDKLHLAAMSRNQGTCFRSWFKERDIFVFSALVSGHGLKNEIYSCSAQVAKPSPGH